HQKEFLAGTPKSALGRSKSRAAPYRRSPRGFRTRSAAQSAADPTPWFEAARRRSLTSRNPSPDVNLRFAGKQHLLAAWAAKSRLCVLAHPLAPGAQQPTHLVVGPRGAFAVLGAVALARQQLVVDQFAPQGHMVAPGVPALDD